jgi:3-isopropylmalate dehydrogenase
MDFKVAVLAGDGIGPEVIAEALKVLHVVGKKTGHTFTITEGLIGGIAIDTMGSALPDETIAMCRESDAVLLGAVGGPKWDDPNATVRPEQGLLGIRKALELFANLRPVTIHPLLKDASPLRAERLEGVDLVVVRELTGGMYFGEKKRDHDEAGEWASDLCCYTQVEVERIVRVAATIAQQRRGKLTMVDKANVLETSRLWRSISARVMRDEFPDIQYETMLVDACAMHLMRRPADFDVIVTENMFGDILTDEASMLAGSMGMLPSASLGDGGDAKGTRIGLYEPIHGSAPDIAGQQKANPLAMILSVALMLRYSFGLEQEAQVVESAVHATLEQGVVTGDVARADQVSASTAQVGDAVTQYIHTAA